jgi:hypothetical protein
MTAEARALEHGFAAIGLCLGVETLPDARRTLRASHDAAGEQRDEHAHGAHERVVASHGR